MTATSPWVSRTMPLLCAAAWLVTLAAAIWDMDAHWPLRILLAALAASLVTQVVRGPTPFVAVSPFITLALIILVFFSLLPSAALAVASETSFIATTLPGLKRLFSEFHSGQGELIILQFSAMCLTGGAVVHWHMRLGAPSTIRPAIPDAAIPHMVKGAVFLIFSLSLFLVAKLWLTDFDDFLRTGLGRQIKDGIPPVLSFALATLIYISAGRGGWWRVLVALSCLAVFAALLMTVAGKAAIFVLISCLALFVLKVRPSIRSIATPGIIGALVLLGGITTQGHLRNPSAGLLSSNPILTWADIALAQKLVMRQLVTNGCLQGALEQRLHQPGRQNPFYFAIAVVPRIFFRDKPNLSQGSLYARDYCGLEPASQQAGIPQNFSVTLLGQPVIQAGLPGLITAQAFLLVALGLVAVICLRTGAAGIITLVALLPWLSDFDQSLMLYIANALKMFLYMSPVLIALVVATRHRSAG